jgi:hypothetical protein
MYFQIVMDDHQRVTQLLQEFIKGIAAALHAIVSIEFLKNSNVNKIDVSLSFPPH